MSELNDIYTRLGRIEKDVQRIYISVTKLEGKYTIKAAWWGGIAGGIMAAVGALVWKLVG